MIDIDGRPDWDAYFMAMACVAATRSSCLRRGVGAVIVRGNRVLATGYNGAPASCRHCGETGCLRQQLGVPSGERHEICRGSHAEMNALAQAAASGTEVRGCVVYCTHEPCSLCTKLLINAGCSKIVYAHPYPDELARELRAEAGLEAVVFDGGDALRAVFDGAAKMM